MTENFNLQANFRTVTGKRVKHLRKAKQIPAVLYGKGFKNQNLSIDLREFEKIDRQAGSSSLVNLKIDDEKPIKILIGRTQKDTVSDKIIHADLIKVNMKEKIHTTIPLAIFGDAPAVIDLEGNLITNKYELEVECLPDDLVSEISVDLSALKTFDDNIKVSDIKIPEGIEILDDLDEVLLMVTPPRSEEELEEELAEATKEEEAEAVAGLEEEVTGEAAEVEEKAEETKKEEPAE